MVCKERLYKVMPTDSVNLTNATSSGLLAWYSSLPCSSMFGVTLCAKAMAVMADKVR